MRWLVGVAFILLCLSVPAQSGAQAPHYFITFDAPITTPPGGFATYSIIQGSLQAVGVGGSLAVAHTSASPNVVIIEVNIGQSVYITTVDFYAYTSNGGNGCFQIHWDGVNQGYGCRHGTGYGGFTLNKTVPPVFQLQYVMIGYGGTRTNGFDDVRLNLGSWATATPTRTPTRTPTPTPSPTPTLFIEGWVPTRVSTHLPICPSTPTPGPSPTRLVGFTPIARVALGGTVYRFPTATSTLAPTSTGTVTPVTLTPTATSTSAAPSPTTTATPTPTATLACIPRHQALGFDDVPPAFDLGIGTIMHEECLTFVPEIDIPQTVTFGPIPILGEVTFSIPFFGGLQVQEHRVCFRYRGLQFAFLGVDMTWVILALISLLGIWFILVFRREL